MLQGTVCGQQQRDGIIRREARDCPAQQGPCFQLLRCGQRALMPGLSMPKGEPRWGGHALPRLCQFIEGGQGLGALGHVSPWPVRRGLERAWKMLVLPLSFVTRQTQEGHSSKQSKSLLEVAGVAAWVATCCAPDFAARTRTQSPGLWLPGGSPSISRRTT